MTPIEGAQASGSALIHLGDPGILGFPRSSQRGFCPQHPAGHSPEEGEGRQGRRPEIPDTFLGLRQAKYLIRRAPAAGCQASPKALQSSACLGCSLLG